MHQSFVTTAPPHLRGRVGDSIIARLKCRAISFQVSSQCRGNDGVLTLGSLPQGDILLRRAGQRAVLTSSLPPGGGVYSRALKAEK